MSKRLCISLLHTPQRSSISSQRCAAHFGAITTRDDNSRLRNAPPRTQGRNFSSSPSCSAGIAQGMSSGKKPMGPSMALQGRKQQEQALKDGSMLDMIGLLNGTFVPPTGPRLPSWFKDAGKRWKLEKLRIFNIFKVAQSKFAAFTMVRPRAKLDLFQTPKIARDLYEGMYKHFAKGDLDPIQGRLSPGLYNSLQRRIAQRQPNTTYEWTLHKYHAKPIIVSYVFGVMDHTSPRDSRTGTFQAIIRIQSKQSLQKSVRMKVTDPKTGRTSVQFTPVDSHGNAITPEDVEQEKEWSAKDTTEHVVVQKHLKQGKEGPWHLWGMAEETTLEKYLKDEEKIREASEHQRRMQKQA